MKSSRLWSLWTMHQFYAENLMNATAFMAILSDSLSGKKGVLSEEELRVMILDVEMIRSNLEQLDLRMAEKHAERILRDCAQPGYDGAYFSHAIQELSTRIKDEVELEFFLYLTPEEADFYKPSKPLFGKQVQNQFPDASFEIDEAGKCLGLDRPTACVFHLMRVMEISLRAVYASMGLPAITKDWEKNWSKILERVKKDIDARKSATPPRWINTGDKDFFEDAYASLDAVRVAWRNATMHVENKYSPEEARYLFTVVKGFMQKIASRMDESGSPLA